MRNNCTALGMGSHHLLPARRTEVQLTLACAWTHTHTHTQMQNTHTHYVGEVGWREGGRKLTNGSSAAQLDGKCVFKQCTVTLTHATLSGRSVI